jgi:hypothetical protein
MLNEEYEGFFDNTKLNRIINRKYKSFAELLSGRTNFYLKKSTITTTAGTYLYSISSSTLSPNKDSVKICDAYDAFLYPINFEYTPTTSSGALATGFDIVGNQIALYPIPSVTGTVYTVWYNEIPADLSGDSSTLSIPNGDIAESFLVSMILKDCQYQAGDMEMYALTRQQIRDDGNKLWSMFQKSRDIEVYHGDGRTEAPVVV